MNDVQKISDVLSEDQRETQRKEEESWEILLNQIFTSVSTKRSLRNAQATCMKHQKAGSQVTASPQNREEQRFSTTTGNSMPQKSSSGVSPQQNSKTDGSRKFHWLLLSHCSHAKLTHMCVC